MKKLSMIYFQFFKKPTFEESLENQALNSIYPPPTYISILSKCHKPPELQENPENQALNNMSPPSSDEPNLSKCQEQTKSSDQTAFKIKFKGKTFNGTPENVINPIDGRKQIKTTDKWPYSVHGVIEGEFNDEVFYGTGIMIGPNIVLTAGHNLYSHKSKAKAKIETLRFKLALKGGSPPFREVEIERSFVTDDYVKEGKEDYGILILKEPIGEVTGYFGLACLDPTELKSKRIGITGYPQDKVKANSETFEMWEMDGLVDEIDEEEGLFSYKIDTGKGQSGSGVVYEKDGEYFVCGIHIQAGQNVNLAILLTRSRYKLIYKWIKENMRKDLNFYLRNCEELKFQDININVECLSRLLKESLQKLTSVKFCSNEIQIDEAILIGQNTSWTNLSQLSLNYNYIGDEQAKALAQNTSWVNLLRLDLSRNNIGDEGMKALAENKSWIKLSELNLSGNKFGGEGAQALAQNTLWEKLSQLNLSRNKIGDEGAKGLAQNILWKNLSKLNLSVNNLRDEGAKGLAQSTSWIHLSKLDLSGNNIGDEGAKGLAKNTSWIHLSQLDLSVNNIGDEGAKGLAQNSSWEHLSRLYLSVNYIGDEGAKGLAQNTSWKNLSQLDLSVNNIGDEGAKGLGQNASWKNLSKLDLSNNSFLKQINKLFREIQGKTSFEGLSLSMNKISDKGVIALAENASWRKLLELNLSFNDIGDRGALKLAQNTSWTTLSQLDLNGNKIGDKGAEALVQANIPALNLSWNYMSYTGARIFPKKVSFSKVDSFEISMKLQFRRDLRGIGSEISSIWETIEASKSLDTLRREFSWYYCSFTMEIIHPDVFFNFIIKISHFMYSRLDLNNSLNQATEAEAEAEDDDEFIKEFSFNFVFYRPTSPRNQLRIEEAHTSAQNYSDLNFNNTTSREEESQPSLKNIYDHSS